MESYKLATIGVQRLSDGAFLREDPTSSAWQEYLAWVAAGNTPAPQFTLEEIAAREQAAADALQRAQDIDVNLPSWAEVQAAIEGITTLAGARTMLLKLARVVYWLAKNKAT